MEMIFLNKRLITSLIVMTLLALASVTFAKDEPAPIRTSYYELQPTFTINYGDIRRTRYIQASITLKVIDSTTQSEVQAHNPAIRNAIIMLFSRQTTETIQSIEGREVFLEEALKEIQNILIKETGEALIDRVLFTSFVLQT